MHLLGLVLEINLNGPLSDEADPVSFSQFLFDSIHIKGTGAGLNVSVNNLEIEWHNGNSPRGFEDVYRYIANISLYWNSLLNPSGRTDLNLSYNSELGRFTRYEIVQSNGLTRDEAGQLAEDFFAGLGHATMDYINKKLGLR